MVTQRRKEIGIRMALGAEKNSILRLIMRDVSILLAVGVASASGFLYGPRTSCGKCVRLKSARSKDNYFLCSRAWRCRAAGRIFSGTAGGAFGSKCNPSGRVENREYSGRGPADSFPAHNIRMSSRVSESLGTSSLPPKLRLASTRIVIRRHRSSVRTRAQSASKSPD